MVDTQSDGSIVVVTGSRPIKESFGSGFVIHKDKESTYVVTCAHVVDDVGGVENIKVHTAPAVVVAKGARDGPDLAVLRCSRRLLDWPAVSAAAAARGGMAFRAKVAGKHSGQTVQISEIRGTLIDRVSLWTSELNRYVTAWRLRVEGDPLQPGHSGSPVVDVASGHVVATVIDRKGQGEIGTAIDIGELQHLWPEMPFELLPACGDTEPRVRLDERLPQGNYIGARPLRAISGRENELQLIRRVIAEVDEGEGRFIILQGGGGNGKTRLAQEVHMLTRGLGYLCTMGSCRRETAKRIFHPFYDVLRNAYDSAPSDVRSTVATNWPFLGRLLPGEPIPDAPSLPDKDQEEERLFWGVAAFFQALARDHPVAVFVDDLQWADRASLEMLYRLAKNTRPHRVLMVGLTRKVSAGHPLRETLETLRREEILTPIPVGPLAREGTQHMVRSVLDQARRGGTRTGGDD